MLDISPLENAIAQIEESLVFAHGPLAKENHRLFLQFRNSAIKSFEYTYELSWKTMKRFIEMHGPPEVETNDIPFRDLLRLAWEYGLIRDVNRWIDFRKERNITSHAYNNDKAAEIFAVIPSFLEEAKYLRDQVNARQGTAS